MYYSLLNLNSLYLMNMAQFSPLFESEHIPLFILLRHVCHCLYDYYDVCAYQCYFAQYRYVMFFNIQYRLTHGYRMCFDRVFLFMHVCTFFTSLYLALISTVGRVNVFGVISCSNRHGQMVYMFIFFLQEDRE